MVASFLVRFIFYLDPISTVELSGDTTAIMPQLSKQIISLSKSALQARGASDQACPVLFSSFFSVNPIVYRVAS